MCPTLIPMNMGVCLIDDEDGTWLVDGGNGN